MALASLEDVKRILRITTTDEDRDAQLRAALAATEAWALRKMKQFALDGEQVEVYWDIPEDATLHLPTKDAVVTLVRVFEYPSAFGVPLSPVELGLGHGFDLSEDGDVILRPSLFVSPFEGATASRRLRSYSRVEVHFIGTGVVPRDVTEGVAFLAAGYWQYGPKALTNMQSEKIGDYSYTIGGSTGHPEEEMPYIRQAMFFLKPFMPKQRVAVI